MAREPRRIKESLRRTFVTPEGVDLRIELASAGARAGALMLDLMMLTAIMITLFVICLATFLSGIDGGGGVVAIIIWSLGWFVLRNFWFTLFEMGGRGATPGKRLVGLRVVARDGARLTGGAVVMRNAMREIEVFLPISFFFGTIFANDSDKLLSLVALLWSLIFLLFPLFNRDRLRIGDMLAGTWVVQRAKAELGQDLVASLAESTRPRRTFTDAQLDLYGIYELQTLEQVLRDGQTDAIVSVAEAIRRKGGIEDDGDDYGFLSDYYAALCARLERGMMVGLRREDKFSPTTRNRAA